MITIKDINHKSQVVVEKFRGLGVSLATAESCTGGWVAQAITSVPGSSAVFECGWVTYSNAAKQACLGLDPQTLENFGAVSSETAVAMAEGALRAAGTDFALSTTGIAGPAGGSPEKPVGTVWFAWAQRGQTTISEMQCFSGDREAVRAQAVLYALEKLDQLLKIR